MPIKVFAAPFKGTAPNAAVAYVAEVDVNSFEFVEKDGTSSEVLELRQFGHRLEGQGTFRASVSAWISS